MYEFLQSGELKSQAKRLLGYRVTLVLVIIVNIALLMRVPLPPPRQAQAGSPLADADRGLQPGLEQPRPDLTPMQDEPQTAIGSGNRLRSEPPVAQAQPAVGPTSRGILFALDAPPPTASTSKDNAGSELETSAQRGDNITRDTRGRAPDDSHMASSRQLSAIPWAAWQRDAWQLAERWRLALMQTRPRHADPVQDSAATPGIGDETAAAAPVITPGLPAPPTAAAEDEPTSGHARREHPVAPAGLTLRNPRENMETVRLLVNHRLCELRPGEAHQFAPGEQWLLQFHRGGTLGNVERHVTDGTYRFTVTSEGWDLVRDDSEER